MERFVNESLQVYKEVKRRQVKLCSRRQVHVILCLITFERDFRYRSR